MAITAKQLMDYYASLEEQMGFAGPAFSASETFKSLFTPLTQQAGIMVKEHFTRIAQQFEESNKAALSSIAQQIGAINSEYFTGFVQQAFENLGRYSGPAFTPPPFYVRKPFRQLPPNVKFIDGEYYYIDDYKPGLN